jgi:hypothetical protein
MARKVNTRTSGEKEQYTIVKDYHGADNKVGKNQVVDLEMSTHDKLYYHLNKKAK